MSDHPDMDDREKNPFAPPQSQIVSAARYGASPRTRYAASIRLIGLTGVLAFVVGIVSRFVRPMIAGPIHYEMMVAVAVQAGLCFFILRGVASYAFSEAIVSLQIGLAITWVLFLGGWSLIHKDIWANMVEAVTGMWIASAVCGTILLWLMRVVNRRRGMAESGCAGRGR